MKIILNKSFGGFRASYAAHKLYAKKKYGIDEIFAYKWEMDGYYKTDKTDCIFMFYAVKDLGDFISHKDVSKVSEFFDLSSYEREDPVFVEVVEELGTEAASGTYAELVVVDIPEEVAKDYIIDDYGGIETLYKRVQKW